MEESGWRVSNLTTDKMLKKAHTNYLENIDRAKIFRPEVEHHIFEYEKVIQLYIDNNNHLVCLTNLRLIYLQNGSEGVRTHYVFIKDTVEVSVGFSRENSSINIATTNNIHRKSIIIFFCESISELVARDIMKVALSQ